MKFLDKFGAKRPEGVDPQGLRRAARPERRHDRPESMDGLRDQVERLHELSVLALFLHSAGTMEEMLALFLERSPRVTGAVVTYPLLLDRRRDLLTAQRLGSVDDAGLEQASLAADENLTDMEYPLPLRSWRRTAMEGGEVVVTDDLRDVLGDVLGREACDLLRQRLEITKAAVVPLVMEGEAFGICVFLYSGTEPDIEVLELAAGHCTLAIKDLTVGEEMTRFGGIDPLTWAHSRGFFLEALEAEVVRAKRFGRGLSIVLFDIDEFGQFNATYGHSLGDRLLRSVAMSLSATLQLPELVSRYGGDDFAVLLPESNRATAVELTAKIVEKIGEVSVFESPTGERQYVSVSAAIVSYPEDGSSRDELLAAAEFAIGESKKERRAAMEAPRQMTAVQQLRLSGRRQHSA